MKETLDGKLKDYGKLYFKIRDTINETDFDGNATGKTVKLSQSQKEEYAKQRTLLKEEILQIFRDNPDINKDLYLLDSAKTFNNIRSEFMGREMIDKLDQEMIRTFTYMNVDKMHESRQFGDEMRDVTKYF